jgi:hypothetical protein
MIYRGQNSYAKKAYYLKSKDFVAKVRFIHQMNRAVYGEKGVAVDYIITRLIEWIDYKSSMGFYYPSLDDFVLPSRYPSPEKIYWIKSATQVILDNYSQTNLSPDPEYFVELLIRL